MCVKLNSHSSVYVLRQGIMYINVGQLFTKLNFVIAMLNILCQNANDYMIYEKTSNYTITVEARKPGHP